MYETNITKDYGNMTGDYIDTFSKINNCTNNENNIESIILFIHYSHAECHLYV